MLPIEKTPEETRVRIRKFLRESSLRSLGAFQLARYGEAAEARKQMSELVEAYVSAQVDARLAGEVRQLRKEQ